jgi:Protein of unknown function (DUF3244).
MKRFILSLCLLAFVGALYAQVPEIPFEMGKVDNPGSVLGGHPRGPITPPSAGLDDHTLYIYGEHPAYTLYLVDTSGDEPDVVYQVSVPANVGTIYLPTTLTGTYELQLYEGGAYYFYGYITL